MITDLTGVPPHDGFDTDTLIGTNAWIVIKHHRTLAGNTFPKIVAHRPPAKGDPVLRVPAWYKRAGNGNKTTPPATALATPPTKATTQRSSLNEKPVASAPPTEQIENPELPPEPQDLDAGDDGTTFPGDDATSDESAA